MRLFCQCAVKAVVAVFFFPVLGSADELYWYYQYAGIRTNPQFPTAIAMGDGKAWPVVFAAAPNGIQPVTLTPFRNTASNTYWHPLGTPQTITGSISASSLLRASDSASGELGVFVDPVLSSTTDQTAAFIGTRQAGFTSTGANVLGLIERPNGTLEVVPKEAFPPAGQTVGTTSPVRSISATPWGSLGVLAGTNVTYHENTALWGWQNANLFTLTNSQHAELAYDGVGRPVVAYYAGSGNVKAGTFDARSGMWQTSEIGSGNSSTQILFPTVATDSKGGVGVAWVSTTSSSAGGSRVMYAYKPLGENWTTHGVTSSVSVPTSIGGSLVADTVASQARVGLAFDGDDLPVISFTGTSGRVYIAYDPLFPTGAIKDERRIVSAGDTMLDDGFVTGPVRFVKEGGGTLIRDGAATNTYGTLVAEGTLVVRNATAVSTGPLEIARGAAVVVEPPNNPLNPALRVDELRLDSAGQLEIGPGRIEISAEGITEAELRQAIATGRGDGDWSGGGGITSAAAAAAPLGTRAIGYIRTADQASIVAFAAPGDTNLDGAVDVFDLVNVATKGVYGSRAPAAWSDGDFNYDGMANVFDLLAITAGGTFGSGNYLPKGPSNPSMASEAAVVPEPIIGAFIATLACGLAARSRSRFRHVNRAGRISAKP